MPPPSHPSGQSSHVQRKTPSTNTAKMTEISAHVLVDCNERLVHASSSAARTWRLGLFGPFCYRLFVFALTIPVIYIFVPSATSLIYTPSLLAALFFFLKKPAPPKLSLFPLRGPFPI